MNQLEIYGNYYKIFKGNSGIPEKVTVISIEGDDVTFVRGHYSKEEFAESMCLIKNKCKSDKILTKITPKQKQFIDDEDKKIQKAIDKADKLLEEFKNGGMRYYKRIIRN